MTEIKQDRNAPAEDDPRRRILAAAEALIAASGVEAATTRAVAAAAGVQAPALYRLFGDKEGLLDAVAEQAMAAYVARKGLSAPDPDPVENLRRGWDAHIAFGLEHPGIFLIMAARPGRDTAAMRRGLAVLQEKLRALALAGRLKTPEARASTLLQATANGTILALLRQPAAERDMSLSREAREAAIAALTGEASAAADGGGERAAATALRARLPEIGGLSPGEKLLLAELLDRIAEGGEALGPRPSSA